MTYNQWNELQEGEHILVLMPEPFSQPVYREFIFDKIKTRGNKYALHLNYIDDTDKVLGGVIRTFETIDQMLSCICVK